MADYTIMDAYQNCVRINLVEEPVVTKRCYIIGRYDIEFVGDTDKDAVKAMEQWALENTPFRGFSQIAKHLGFYDLFIDQQGRRFLHGFYDGKGKFQFAHPGIEHTPESVGKEESKKSDSVDNVLAVVQEKESKICSSVSSLLNSVQERSEKLVSVVGKEIEREFELG